MDIVISSCKMQSAFVNSELSCHSFKVFRQAHLPRVTSIDIIERRLVTMILKIHWLLTNCMHYIGNGNWLWQPRVSSHTVGAICTLQVPSNITEPLSLIAFPKVFRHIVRISTHIAAFLHYKQLKEELHVCTELPNTELEALHTLQEEYTLTPVLSLPGPQGSHTVDIDTLHGQVGWVLDQRLPDGHK